MGGVRLPSFGQWSVRARLIVGVGVLVAVALLAMATLSVMLMRAYLIDQADNELNVAAGRLFNRMAIAPPRVTGLGPQAAPGSLPTPFVFSLIDANGNLLDQIGGTEVPGRAGPDLSGLTADRVAALGDQPTTVPSVDGSADFRIRTAQRGNGTTAVMAFSLQSMNSALDRLIVVAFLTALIMLVMVVVLSALVIRFGMRPLIDMEHTAEAISSGDLTRRVPTGSARTEVGRLGASFNAMVTKIEAAFTEKDHSEQTLRRFVADAGHELRTPLSTIRGYAELTRTGALPDQPARDQALERIEAEAVRLGVLVDELLLLARLDQHRPLNPSRVDLAALATDAVADAQILDPARNINYSGPEAPAIASVDADRIRQVLTNLLNNALTHTPAGTPVRVRVESVGTTIRVSVQDEGPGLTADQVSRVFERFYRVDAGRDRSRGGSGLGLAIVQGVVVASGGTVTCESTPGAGTTFTVTLPAAG